MTMINADYETPDAVHVRAIAPNAICHYSCETKGYRIWDEPHSAEARLLIDGSTPAEAWAKALEMLTAPDTPVA
jgi:hypothetical protein